MTKKFSYLLIIYFLFTFISGCGEDAENPPPPTTTQPTPQDTSPIPPENKIPATPVESKPVEQNTTPIVSTPDAPQPVVAQTPALPTKMPIFDATARYLAGISQTEDNDIRPLEKLSFWQDYQKNFDENWQKMTTERLDKMASWQQAEFSKQRDGKLPLFYPFSGPDFIHAYYLYPETNYYLFLAKEKVGDSPDLIKMSEKQLETYVSNVHHALRDIYRRSYFITGHMGEDLSKSKINGVLPIFYVFLVRSHNEILQVQKLAMDEKGVIKEYNEENRNDLSKLDIQGVKFIFKPNNTDNVKTLVYFDMDISDDGFTKNPNALLYVKSLGTANTYVKSASYLMHYRTFNQIRDVVLNMSNTVFEDDTGVPYKYFDKKIWDIQLFGNYIKPIKDFKGVDQPELKTAYQDKASVKDLPFSTGYHWANDEQNYLLAIRKPVESTTESATKKP